MYSAHRVAIYIYTYDECVLKNKRTGTYLVHGWGGAPCPVTSYGGTYGDGEGPGVGGRKTAHINRRLNFVFCRRYANDMQNGNNSKTGIWRLCELNVNVIVCSPRIYCIYVRLVVGTYLYIYIMFWSSNYFQERYGCISLACRWR